MVKYQKYDIFLKLLNITHKKEKTAMIKNNRKLFLFTLIAFMCITALPPILQRHDRKNLEIL